MSSELIILFKRLRLLNSFRPKDLLDIGANKGEFATMFKEYFPSAKRFLLIEANQDCSPILETLPFDYKICLLSCSNKEVDFYVDQNDSSGSGNSYYPQNYLANRFKKKVMKTITLEKLFKDINYSFEFIKLDTQGSELDILKGGLNILNNAKFVIIECMNSKLRNYNEGSPTEDEVINFMKSKGFNYHLVVDEHIWQDKIDNNYKFKYGTVFQRDYLFTRNKLKGSKVLRINLFLDKLLVKNKILFKIHCLIKQFKKKYGYYI